ncbi:MAG TPA: hypothetical protein VEH83_01400 [Gemmatimonadales bacterium]|nr:hypothetical protein [Gemmatimonadales bacterium]
MSASLALATCAEYPGLSPDDRLLLPALERLGAAPAPVRWDDPARRWGGFDAVVVRSCWDYHHRLPDFLRWLDRLEREGARVLNPLPTLRWNVTKSYLRELAAAGVSVTPTVWVPVGSTATLGQVADEIGAEAVVVKPNVSATAFETWRFDRARATDAEAQFARLVRERDLMVQPFLPAIETDGELSLVFLGGAFSHAVRKRPRPGDFRVQEEHGGTAEAAAASADLVRQAARALAVAPGDPLYARVDGLASDGTLIVTELELVEPMLYFGWDAGAADRMAAALMRRVGAG